MTKSPIAFETLRRSLTGNFVGRIVQIFSLLASAVVLARMLGPEGLGIVAIVSAAVRLLVVPAQEGCNKLCEREIAGAIGKADGQQAQDALRFNVLASLLVCLLGMIVVPAFLTTTSVLPENDEGSVVLGAAVALLASTIAVSALRGLLRGEGQTVRAISTANAITLAIPLTYLGWIWVGGTLTSATALWLQVGVKVAALPLLFLLVRRYWGLVPKIESPTPISTRKPRRYISESLQFTLLGLVAIALLEVTTIMIGYFGTSEEAGHFRIASRVFVIVGIANFAANQAFGPHIAKMWQSGNSEALEAPSRMISVLALATSGTALLFFAVFGRWLLVVLFGTEFEAAYLPAVILGLGALTVSFGAVSGRLLKMTGEQRTVTTGSLVGLGVVVILNVALIPKYGAVGGAVAVATGITFARIMHSRGVKKHMGFMPFPNGHAVQSLLSRIINMLRRQKE